MRESTSSKEPLSGSSDHERSFERTRDSYIACINRSLEHAFEFLSETGYASAGHSDAERVESRSEDELDRSRSDFIADINAGLAQRGVEEVRVPDTVWLDGKREIKLGQLWGPNDGRKNMAENRRQNAPGNTSNHGPDSEHMNTKNMLHKTVCEERMSPTKSGKKIVIYQHLDSGQNQLKNRSRSSELIGPKRALQNGVKGIGKTGMTNRNGQIQNGRLSIDNIDLKLCEKENASPEKKLHEREDSGYESKAEARNEKLMGMNEFVNKKNEMNDGMQKIIESSKKDKTQYLTTEREIFKQILTNAKELELIEHKHKRKSKSLSNLDLRRAASKISLGPTSRQRPTVKPAQTDMKGFKKFRESFRRTTSYFMPQKFAVHHEKDAEEDITNAFEFQYHCMRDSRDGNEPIKSSKNADGKKKGFFRNLFERKRGKPRLRRHFKSTEAIGQTRWQSRENLNRHEKKAKNDRPISMLIDKIKDTTENENIIGHTIDDESSQVRKNSFKGPRFRRSVSLRSIPISNCTPGYSESGLQIFDDEVMHPVRIQQPGLNRPISVHGVLLRATSLDASAERPGTGDYHNLHRVLRNRYSCCSIDELHNCTRRPLSVDQISLDSRGYYQDEIFSPRKNDDITEWIRGLQYSSGSKAKQRHDCFEEEQEIEYVEEQERLKILSDEQESFHPETRIVNGQKQTYL